MWSQRSVGGEDRGVWRGIGVCVGGEGVVGGGGRAREDRESVAIKAYCYRKRISFY